MFTDLNSYRETETTYLSVGSSVGTLALNLTPFSPSVRTTFLVFTALIFTGLNSTTRLRLHIRQVRSCIGALTLKITSFSPSLRFPFLISSYSLILNSYHKGELMWMNHDTTIGIETSVHISHLGHVSVVSHRPFYPHSGSFPVNSFVQSSSPLTQD